jgi:pullulanase/glycogen debranching enzyme
MTVRASLVEPGTAHPLGASVVVGGVNLCVYSKRATGIDVLLFDGPDDLVPAASSASTRRSIGPASTGTR